MSPRKPSSGSPAGTPAAMTLAANLRSLRSQAGFTLAELAARAGIGKSTLAQLESGRGNPSIDTMFALSEALDVPLTGLLAAPTPQVRVVRRHEGTRLDSSDHVFHAEVLASTGRHGSSEIFSIEIEDLGVRVAKPHARGTVEHVLVYQGRLRTGPSAQPVELSPGDLASFDADVPHCYEALEVGTRALLVADYPW